MNEFDFRNRVKSVISERYSAVVDSVRQRCAQTEAVVNKSGVTSVTHRECQCGHKS